MDDFPDYDPMDNSIKCYDVAIKALREKGVREGRFEPMNVEELEIAPKKKRARKASDEYAQFLSAKSHTAMPVGIEPQDGAFPSAMKPFQIDLTRWALRRGRAAIFAGTGLGKTLMQLTWADAVAKETNGRVLILTPLAVAQQTVAEAAKFGIEGVAYALDAEHQNSRIVVTNYDRFDKFNPDDYSAVVLDESSIIKAHDSKTRKTLIAACKNIPYRLCCTATPAPNDWVELGNHSEFLGVMTDKEMLSMYFVHDGSVRAKDSVEGDGWRLKRHAADAFWRWVASWAAVIRHPKDLGYDEPGYDLPELIRHQITVDVDAPLDDGSLFGIETTGEARTLQERIAARRNSIPERVGATVRLVCEESFPDQTQNICGTITKTIETDGTPGLANSATDITKLGGINTQRTPRSAKGKKQQVEAEIKAASATVDCGLNSGSHQRNMTHSLGDRTADAQSAIDPTGIDQGIGSISITATIPAMSGGCSAPTAISPLGSSGTVAACLTEPLNTFLKADGERWLIWCGLNSEQDAIAKHLGDACFSVYGSLDRDEKVRRVMGWINGERSVLVSKASICGFGMNFQCCSRMVFCGMNDSFEQLYQAIRRCWRFGQTKPVNVYMVASSQEGAVIKNLERKELAYDVMGEAMAGHMREFVREEVRGSQRKAEIVGKVKMEIPVWLNA